MSCPWMEHREKKSEEKTVKYGPLRFELKKQYPGYEVEQCNIIFDVLGGWSRDLDLTLTMGKLFGSRAHDVLEGELSKLPSLDFPLGNSIGAQYSFSIREL